MPAERYLGLYWGMDSFHLVETVSGNSTNVLSIPFTAVGDDPGGLKSVTQEIKFVGLLQKVAKENNILATKVFLSLPSENIILRSFTIPWMKPSELDGVIAFEAKKYVPFPIEQIKYTYQPFPIVEDEIKKFRVLFVGIRKSIFESYTNTLIQAGFDVVYAEPSAMGIVRALNTKKVLKESVRTGIVQIYSDQCKIIIVEDGVPQFVRDFQLKVPTNSQDELPPDPEMVKAKFYNEVRMSLDFYARQHSQDKIEQVLIVAFPGQEHVWQGIDVDLGVEVKVYDPSSILNISQLSDLSLLAAFGATHIGKWEDLDGFNLLAETQIDAKRLKQQSDTKPINVVNVVKAVGIAFLAVALGFFTTIMPATNAKKQVKKIKEDLGVYADMDLETINAKIKTEEEKLEALESLPVRSQATYFLAKIPHLMPESVWLTGVRLNMEIVNEGDGKKKSRRAKAKKSKKVDYTMKDEKFSIELSGNAYDENPNLQFQVVNSFLENLRKDEKFSLFFDEINLDKMSSAQGKDNKRITTFSISCK